MTTMVSETQSTHHHFRRIPIAVLRDRYASGATLADMASEFGLCPRSLSIRARNLGLVFKIKTKRPLIKPTDEGLFTSMWLAGVASCEIADYFKVTTRTVINTNHRIGLPPRIQGSRPRMTLAQFFEARLGEKLLMQARLEQQQMINAEMVDRVNLLYVGARHVRELQIGGKR